MPAMLLVTCSVAQTNLPQASRLEIAQGSKVRIVVTSRASPWQFESQALSGFIEIEPAVLTDATQIPQLSRLRARAEVGMTVGGFKSLGKDGQPYSEKMDQIFQKGLKKDRFPAIRYYLHECTLREGPGKDGPILLNWKGDLAIAGKTNRIVMPVRMFYLRSGEVLFTGTTSLNMYQFGLSPPELPVRTFINEVSPEVLVSFECVAAKTR